MWFWSTVSVSLISSAVPWLCASTSLTYTNVVTSVRQHLVSISISEEDVLEALNSLDPDKSSGIDFIGPRVLNKCAYPLCGPLHHLFSTSLCKHTIPYDWRIHVITPVHKSGDKPQVNNYRPISLLSNTSKVLEQLIYNKVIHHISSFLTPQQFGFLKHRSTVQQLLVLFDVIMNTDHQIDVTLKRHSTVFHTMNSCLN